MKKERVIELAEEAGITFVTKSGVASATEEWLCSFAQLVRNEALEEAAKHCEKTAGVWLSHGQADVTAKEIRSLKS